MKLKLIYGDIMKLEDIRVEWKADSKIEDELKLDNESLRTASLHQKYMDMLSQESYTLKKLYGEKTRIYKEKWLYYSGKASPEVYKEKGVFQHKVLKNDLEMFIESDDEYLEKKLQIDYQEEKVKFLESVIKQISQRDWQIRNAIEWRKLSGIWDGM